MFGLPGFSVHRYDFLYGHPFSRDTAMNDYWIPITYSEDTAERLKAAIAACYQVHLYTLEQLNTYFLFHAENYRLGAFRHELAVYLKKNKLDAQHYSLTKAAEQTFPYFTENKKINGDGKFVFVEPVAPENYQNIQIEPRQVWQKYLALNSLITTCYGTIQLDEQRWPEIVGEQAAAKNIEFSAVPFYWHSVVIHVDDAEPLLRFNLHEPNSKFGKRARKEMKQHVG